LGEKRGIFTGGQGVTKKFFDNPLFGVADVRSSRDFFQLCLELRKKLKEEWKL